MYPKEVKCPECEREFVLEEDLQVGDVTYCSDCDAALKVVKLNPPKLVKEKSSFDDFEGDGDTKDTDFDYS